MRALFDPHGVAASAPGRGADCGLGVFAVTGC